MSCVRCVREAKLLPCEIGTDWGRILGGALGEGWTTGVPGEGKRGRYSPEPGEEREGEGREGCAEEGRAIEFVLSFPCFVFVSSSAFSIFSSIV